MIKFSHVTYALDAGLHATHSGMVIGHDLHDIMLGHISLEVLFAAYVLVRLAIELARSIGKGWRRVKAYRARRKEAREAAKQAATDQPAPAAG